jgi:spermidine synthase
MYQVAWTRRLISVTSATATAQAVVLAVFMVGLGLGAFVAGRRAARLRRPLVGYAGVELAAAAFSLVSFALIDASDGVRGTLLALAGPAAVWIQLILVSSYLLLPTVLMGASLPLLIEQTLSESARC